MLIENPSATPETGVGLDRGEFIDNIRNRDVAFGDETGLMSLATGAGSTGGVEIVGQSIKLNSAGLFSLTSRDADGNLGQAGNIKLGSGVTFLENSRIQFGSGLSSETGVGVDIFAQNGMSITGQSYLYSHAGLKLTGGVAIIGASLVEAGSSTVQLGGGMKLEANSAWNSPNHRHSSGDTRDFQQQHPVRNRGVHQAERRLETGARQRASGQCPAAQHAGNLGAPHDGGRGFTRGYRAWGRHLPQR